MPRRKRVSAKTFSSILPCLRSSICCSKISISRPSSSGIRAASLSFQLSTFSIAISLAETEKTYLIKLVRNQPKKFLPRHSVSNRSDVVHQRAHFGFTEIGERGFLQNHFHRSHASRPGFDQPLRHGRDRAALHLRPQVESHERPFQHVENLLHRDGLRRTRQDISARRPPRSVHQAATFEQHHDLTKILGRYMPVLGYFLHLHGTPLLVILHQLRQGQEPIMSFRADLHMTPIRSRK